MTTFKEIDINEYKKLLDNMQHTYAKILILIIIILYNMMIRKNMFFKHT